jgi:SAM-dependent methyltransferase
LEAKVDRARLYDGRRLTEGYPGLEELGMALRDRDERRADADQRDVGKMIRYLGRLVDLTGPRNIAVIGCGHRPKILQVLRDSGHHAVGVEPVLSYVNAANAFLGRDRAVLVGAAEDIPLADGSQDVVWFENVLEHVDSASRSLSEIHRVLAPGGIAYVTTNSRLYFSPLGHAPEFRVRFYNWLPAMVKESYVHLQLHYRPELANYSTRPAVHWFDYAGLCAAGREAGFGRFYSLLDILDPGDPSVADHRLRRLVLSLCKYQPWVRALTLTQLGGAVFMWKRGVLSSTLSGERGADKQAVPVG